MYSKLFFSLSFGSLLALIFCIFPRSRVWIPLLDQLSGLGISLLAVHGIPLLAAAVLLLLFAAAPLIHNLKPVISALSSSISYNQTRHTFFFSGLMLSLSSLYFLISLSDLFFLVSAFILLSELTFRSPPDQYCGTHRLWFSSFSFSMSLCDTAKLSITHAEFFIQIAQSRSPIPLQYHLTDIFQWITIYSITYLIFLIRELRSTVSPVWYF